MLCRIFNQITKCIKKIFNRPKIKDSKRGSVISKTEFGRKSFPFWKKKSVQILTTTHQRGCFSRRKTHNSEYFLWILKICPATETEIEMAWMQNKCNEIISMIFQRSQQLVPWQTMHNWRLLFLEKKIIVDTPTINSTENYYFWH